MAHVIIVVPCFNEERRLRLSAFEEFAIPGHRLEFCFVNDGSTDATSALLAGLHARRPDKCMVVDLPRNQGKAEAVRQGFQAALGRGADFVGFWDADLATPLREIPDFMRVLTEDHRRQMVFGSRVRLMGRMIERRALRHYLGRVFATAVSLILGLGIYDTQCGAKLFRASDLLREVFSEPFRARWIFDVEIIARFLGFGIERGWDSAAEAIYELPLSEWRDVEGTKLKTMDFMRAIKDLWIIRGAYPARDRRRQIARS